MYSVFGQGIGPNIGDQTVFTRVNVGICRILEAVDTSTVAKLYSSVMEYHRLVRIRL